MNNTSARNNPVLQQVAQGFMNRTTDFVMKELFPSITVSSLQGDIKAYGKDHLRIINTIQGDGPSAVLTHSVSKATKWDLEKHALKSLVTEKDMDQLGPEQAKMDFTEMTTETLMIAREKADIDVVCTTGNYTANNTVTLVGNQQWSDFVNSTPKTDLATARERVRTNVGRYPNVVLMSPLVLAKMMDHPSFLLAATYVGENRVSLDRLKDILFPTYKGSECKILVSLAQYNSAKKGQTAVMTDIMGKHFLYAYVNPNPNPSQRETSFSYSFHRKADSVQARTWIEPDLDPQPWTKVEWEYDDVVMDFKAGYLIYNAVA